MLYLTAGNTIDQINNHSVFLTQYSRQQLLEDLDSVIFSFNMNNYLDHLLCIVHSPNT